MPHLGLMGMARYRLQLSLNNQPEALGKLILLIKQARLSLIEANIKQASPEILNAQLLIDGREEKIQWLLNKLILFPYFKSVDLMSIEVARDVQ